VTRRSASPVGFNDALELVEALLQTDARARVIDALVDDGNVGGSLDRLRKAFRSHTMSPGSTDLRRVVDTLDARTRREGFHVLQGWDFVEHRFAKDIAPVLLVDYCARLGIAPNRLRESVAVLLDQYFLAVLSLFAIRAWDDGDASENLDRVTRALTALQGPHGSGHEFVADAETLLMLAVSYFHPEEHGYELLVGRVSGLDGPHRMRFAVPCAALMGFHLRWGLRFMYKRDVGRMRDDNVADYPLLTLALVTLAEEYASPRGDNRARIIEGLLNGLSADPWAFQELIADRGKALLEDFAAYPPSPRAFSPLSFTCNFPTNASVALATLAVHGEKHPALNALFTREGERSDADESAHRLARRLMEFATSDSSRLGAGGVPLLAYDPFEGAHAYNTTLRTLRDASSRGSSRS
jgi:AcrR family transcriptional regulator